MTTQQQRPEPVLSAHTRQLGSTQAAWLVAEREISTKLRSKAFLISTGVLLLLVLGTVLFGGISSKMGGFGGETKVAVVAETADHVNSEAFEVVKVADRAAAEQAVLSEKVDAAVVPGGDTPVGLTVLAADSPPMSLVQALSASPQVEPVSYTHLDVYKRQVQGEADLESRFLSHYGAVDLSADGGGAA